MCVCVCVCVCVFMPSVCITVTTQYIVTVMDCVVPLIGASYCSFIYCVCRRCDVHCYVVGFWCCIVYSCSPLLSLAVKVEVPCVVLRLRRGCGSARLF